MSAADVNYRHGISNARVAIQTDTGEYDTPWALDGAESVTPNAADGNATTWYSDNGNPATVNGTNGGGTLDLQFSEFSKKYHTDVLGHSVDSTTGGIIKGPDDKGATFAFGFKVEGTSKGTKVWKFGCTSSEPIASAFQTDTDTPTESPETCTLTVGGDTFTIAGAQGAADTYVSAYELVCHEGETGYDTFLDTVPVPNPAA